MTFRDVFEGDVPFIRRCSLFEGDFCKVAFKEGGEEVTVFAAARLLPLQLQP